MGFFETRRGRGVGEVVPNQEQEQDPGRHEDRRGFIEDLPVHEMQELSCRAHRATGAQKLKRFNFTLPSCSATVNPPALGLAEVIRRGRRPRRGRRFAPELSGGARPVKSAVHAFSQGQAVGRWRVSSRAEDASTPQARHAGTTEPIGGSRLSRFDGVIVLLCSLRLDRRRRAL